MPKGGLLHAHLDATVNVHVLLQLALQYPAFHVRTPVRLAAETIGSTLPEFYPLKKCDWTNQTSLTSDNYTPGTWVSLASARATFDPNLGGPEGFDRWVTAALTVNPTEAYQTHNTTNKVLSFILLDTMSRAQLETGTRSGKSSSLASRLQGYVHIVSVRYVRR